MPMHKYVKIGGSYYEGQKLTVSSAAADYVLDMAFTAAGGASAMTVIPDQAGAGDTFDAQHLDVDGNVTRVLAKDVPNVGRNASWRFEYPGLQKFGNGESLRIVYTNVASVAMNVYVVLEQLH